MQTLVLNYIQMSKINDYANIKCPINDRYTKETENNNEKLNKKIHEYTEAYKNATKYYVF